MNMSRAGVRIMKAEEDFRERVNHGADSRMFGRVKWVRRQMPHWALSALGLGVDTVTVGAATDDANMDPGPSNEKLLHLNVLWPDEVDRVCADQRKTRSIVEGFLTAKSMAIAAGESTIGKSALVCQLGLCVAAGIPFLGMPTEQGRVLYFDLENSLDDHKKMRDALLKHLSLNEAPRGFLVTQDPSKDLERLMEAIQPSLVLVDSLRSYRPDVTDTNRAAGEWLQHIRGLISQT